MPFRQECLSLGACTENLPLFWSVRNLPWSYSYFSPDPVGVALGYSHITLLGGTGVCTCIPDFAYMTKCVHLNEPRDWTLQVKNTGCINRGIVLNSVTTQHRVKNTCLGKHLRKETRSARSIPCHSQGVGFIWPLQVKTPGCCSSSEDCQPLTQHGIARPTFHPVA